MEGTAYVSLNNKYVICASPSGNAFDNSIYDWDLNLIDTIRGYAESLEQNLLNLVENNILFRGLREGDTITDLNADYMQERITNHQIFINALNLNGMQKEYEILDKLCDKYDFLSINITESGLTLCCSTYSDKDKAMMQCPWVEITHDGTTVLGNADTLNLYFDGFGEDAFAITRHDIANIVDCVGQAANIPEFERMPALLPLMVDKTTYENCSGLCPAFPDYDKVAEASKEYYAGQEAGQEHKKNIDIDIDIHK